MFITVFKKACHWSQTWARWQFSKLLIKLQILTYNSHYPKDKSVMDLTWHEINSCTCIMHCHSSIFTTLCHKQHSISHLHKSVKEPGMVVKIML
jgi:hypothetical protein